MSTSGASAAPTVSAFITIALSGSTTEPVISHRTTKVSADQRGRGRGAAGAAIAACWSTNSAAGPVDLHVNGAGVARTSSHQPLRGCRPTGRRAARDVHLPGVRAEVTGAARATPRAVTRAAYASTSPRRRTRARSRPSSRAWCRRRRIGSDGVGDASARSCPVGITRRRRPASSCTVRPAARRRASTAAVTARDRRRAGA